MSAFGTRNLILFDDDTRDHLLPLTFTRPVCELRCGILTLREKWERRLGGTASYITQDYLSERYDIVFADDNYIINGGVFPDDELVARILALHKNEALLHDGELIAARLDRMQFDNLTSESSESDHLVAYDLEIEYLHRLRRPYDLFRLNFTEIERDFALLTADRESAPLNDSNWTAAADQIFVEEGADVNCATLNATDGPIYIGEGVKIMEGSHLRGPLAICRHSVVKMGSKLYGGTTLGPHCKVGGEVGNSVLLGYSNKGHEGYLGNSVLGKWCNLGADTNTSNLKNNYSPVRVWNYPDHTLVETDQQFCGLIMGDHSKAGINTMFNTGTTVGVAANIYGGGFPPKFVPSFAWGGADGFATHDPERALETGTRVLARRGIEFSPLDTIIMLGVFEQTARYRHWEADDEEE